ncbi:hypothetical protein J6590_057424 [Homalodisca vitripennis]|nr:hypothetical protein J6590_057424 [Homalodisca vitripennis]
MTMGRNNLTVVIFFYSDDKVHDSVESGGKLQASLPTKRALCVVLQLGVAPRASTRRRGSTRNHSGPRENIMKHRACCRE